MKLPVWTPLSSYDLTKAQLRVAELILDGHSNDAIAKQLFVHIKTVKYHISHVYKVLKIKTRSEFIVKHLPAHLRARDQSEIGRLQMRIAELERLLGRQVFDAREKFADVLPLGRR